MFGGSGFGSGFGQNQQSQGTSGFGAAGTGTTGTTGGGFGSFGQPAQQQQQQQQPSTGFGSTGGFGSAQQPSTGFGTTSGGFGQQSTFGQNKPFGSTGATTGAGGLFGGGTATAGGGGFGTSGGGFGATTGTTTQSSGFGTPAAGQTSGLFGAAKPAGPGFGGATTGTGGLFGGGATTSAGTTPFGGASTTPSGFGATAGSTLQVPQNGTASPPFEVYQEKDAASSMMNHFHTIAFQGAYQKASLEELRMQDYAQNRRFASGPAAGAFGPGGFGTAFGQQQQQPAQTTGFGQPATTSSGGGLFGSGTSATAAGGFGATGTTGGFGTTAATPASGGLFGQNKPAGGLFGSTPGASTTPGGVFGNTGTTGFGAQTGTPATGFGQTSATGGGLFGQQSAQTPKPGGGFGTGFGTTGTTGTPGFGQQTGATAFGQSSTTTPAAGGLFGQPQQQQQQQATGGFGQPQQQQAATSSPFGTGFGQQAQQPQQQGTGFGTFGQQAGAQNKPAFATGFGSTTPAANPPAGGLFGGAQQTATPQAGGLFGTKAPFGTPTAATGGGGLFGSTTSTTPAAAPGGGLFGPSQPAQGTTGGLFGQQQQTQNAAGGLFGGAKPAGTGLFGSQPQAGASASGGLFGSSIAGNPQGQGSSIFGQNPAAQNATGAFGASQGGGMFGGGQSMLGGSNIQANPMMLGNQPLNSSLDQRPYGNMSLIDGSQNVNPSPGPIATPLATSTQTKKNAMIPHNKIAPRQPTLTPRISQPFTRSVSPFSSSTGPAAGGSLGRSFGSAQNRNTLGNSLFDGGSDDSILSSAFSSPGNRSASLKKLVIDRKIRDADLFSASSDPKAIKDSSRDDGKALQSQGILKKTVSFDTTVGGDESRGSSATAGEAPTNALGFLRTPTKSPAVESPSNGAQAPHTPPIAESSPPDNIKQVATTSTPEGSPNDKSPQEGEYWSVPSAAKLSTIPREQLRKVSEFTVGRRGYGQIRFDEPVDLTTLVSVDEIAGGLITFGTRVCTVYPPGWDKPPPGEGLNKPATITLENCYPTNREDKKPIKDTEHPRYHFHLKRLKNIKDTEFVDYLVQDGIWIFKVKHFTAYGLDDDDDDLPLRQAPNTSLSRISEHSNSFVGSASAGGDSSFASEDVTFGENPDDTFDFKRHSGGRFHGSSMMDHDQEMDDSQFEGDVTLEGQSFMDSTQELLHSESEDEPTEILDQNDDSVAIMVEDGQALVFNDATRLSPPRDGTPEPKLAVGRDWTEQLVQTISPVKNRRLHHAGDETPTKAGVAALGPLDFTGNFYGGSRVFESPLRTHTRTFGTTLSNKKRNHADMGLSRPEPYNPSKAASDDQAFHNCVRPAWGPNGEILYAGSLEGSRPRGFGDLRSSRLCNSKLKFSNVKASAITSQMELLLAASKIELDRFGVPHAQLDKDLPFSQFARINADAGDPQQSYEKTVWQLASVLFDPIDLKLPENATFHTRQYLKDKTRKDMLSKFFEQLVAKDADKSVNSAMSCEEAAIGHLSAHRVEDACAALLEGSDFRLATIMPLIGGDRSVRADMQKQLHEWRASGVLAEIPLAVRVLYELLAGNTNYSEGIAAPMEDVTPSFYIGERYGLDWRRTFALRLWYTIFEDQSLEEAVRRYERDFRAGDGKNIQRPIPWYLEPNSDLPHVSKLSAEEAEDSFDLLWGLLKLYSEEHCNLEDILNPANYNPLSMDYRISWLLRMTLSEKQIRDFTVGYDGASGEEAENTLAEQLTVDFATQLEVEGQWGWALLILMFLNDADSREIGIRNLLGRHVSEFDLDNEKHRQIFKKLNIPQNWVDESRALQSRNLHQHFEEVDHLFAASAWNEAHRTIIRHVAPSCVIAEDLSRLYDVLGKFSSVETVSEWAVGGQVYIDFINLQAVVNKSASFTPRVPPKMKGLPKNNSHRDIAKRLLDALPRMETKEFAQYVSISEIAKTLSSFVLKSKDLQSEAEKILELPLNDDQYLRKTLMLSYNQYVNDSGVITI